MTARALPAAPLRATRIGFAAPPRGAAAGWWTWLRRAWRARATRRDLRDLDARALRDIGLTRAQALREAGRAPWDV